MNSRKAMLMAIILFSEGAWGYFITPNSASVEGGAELLVKSFESGAPVTVRIGGVVAADSVYPDLESCSSDKGDEFCVYVLRCIIPPRNVAGSVDVEISLLGNHYVYADALTYYDTPIPQEVTPSVYSVLPINKKVTVKALGVSGQPGVRVFFGGREATQVSVSADGLEVTCIPPQFFGGTFPLEADVKIVNPGGGEGAAQGLFTYNRLDPVLIANPTPVAAWTDPEYTEFDALNLISGNLRVYVDGIPGFVNAENGRTVYARVPALPPGKYGFTVVNSDGGVSYMPDGLEYVGPPSTNFHPGDLNQDFRFSMSEVLRVCQFFNSDGYQCDASTEDGYAVGSGGDQSCVPYPTDNAPQNWRIDLNELLEIIQFYNLHCYQPCPGAPGTYCPPD